MNCSEYLLFNKDSNKLVCEEAILAMRELFEQWRDKASVEYPDFTDVTVQVQWSYKRNSGN
jgi:hypothetical protein